MLALLTFLGLIAVAFIILIKRSIEIISVNPLKGQYAPPPPAAQPPAPQLGRILGLIQESAQQRVSGEGRGAIRALIKNNQFIEAIQLYQKLYGVRLSAAKKAVDEMMLEQ